MIQKLRRYVITLEERVFYQYMASALVIFVLLIGLLVYRHYRVVGSIQRDIKRLNEQRKQAQELLTQQEQVRRQQDKIDTLLEKEPTFKIREYFEQVLEKLGIKDFSREMTAAENDIEINPLYKELTVETRFKGLTMKQVADLLVALEQKKRVYLKELTIEKVADAAVVNVQLILATLQRKPESATAEQTE